METQWTARQLRALEPEATVEERLSFDAGIISLLGRSTTEGLCTVVWCDGEPGLVNDIAETAGYLIERFDTDEAEALYLFCEAGPEGKPRAVLRAAIGIFLAIHRAAANAPGGPDWHAFLD